MFRRSGSFACFFVETAPPDPRSADFVAALAKNRFRTIEDAADEQTSVGWVTPGDPSGNTFELEDMDRDGSLWLRVRIDKKTAPAKWLQIHREVAEKSAGRRLGTKERRELREDLLSTLMPRVLPTIRMIDALYLPGDGVVLLFGTSNAVREAFLSLFYRTFGSSLAPADPHGLALSAGLDRPLAAALDQVTPIAWPRSTGGGEPRARPAAARDPADAEVGA
jgi:DNA recombination-dependent growth factor C